MMKRSALAVAVCAALGLTACNNSEVAEGTDETRNEQTEATVASAEVRFAAKFPQADDAQAALIDPRTGVIGVRVIEMPAGVTDWPTYGAAVEECISTSYNSCVFGYELPYALTPAATAVLSPSSPSASVNLFPNKTYLVDVRQFDSELSMATGDAFASAPSLITVADGTNNVAINLVHGTWRLGSPITLNLLNNATLMASLDADGDGTTTGEVDWDPSTTAVDTAAQALGLGAGTLNGFDLVGSGFFNANFDTTNLYFDPQETDGWVSGSGGTYFPLLRVDDGAGGEQLVVPEGSGGDSCDPYAGCTPGAQVSVHPVPGQLLHQYDATNGNRNSLFVGELNIEYAYFDGNWNDLAGYDAGLFTLSESKNPVGTAVDDGTNWVYDEGQDGWSDVYQNGTYTDANGIHDLWVAQVDSGSWTSQHPNTDTPISDYPLTAVSGGTSIAGTLIEYVSTGWSDSPVAGSIPTYDGADPTATTAAAGGTKSASLRQLIQKAVGLELKARELGLKASAAANTYGTDCVTLTGMGQYTYSEFYWDYQSSSWVPGTRNWSYWWDDMIGAASGDDLDGDGTPEPVEAVFWNDTYQMVDAGTGYAETCANGVCTLDPTTPGDYFGEDLDGDGVIEDHEGVPTAWSESGTTEVCMHTFTASGGQLELTGVDTGVVVAGQ